MIRDFRYIIKRIIIGLGIALSLFYLKGYVAYAATIDTFTVDGTQMSNSSYYWQQGNTARIFRLIGVGPETYDTNLYVNMLFCVNTQDNIMSGDAWSNANDTQSFDGWGTRNSIGINFTNVPCKLAGAGYDSKIVQVYGITRTGQDGGGDIYMTVRLSINQASSLSLLKYSISTEPVELILSEKDYTDQLNSMMTTITNTWQVEINKLQDIWNVDQATLAEAQTQTGWQKRIAEASEALHNLMNSDDIDGNDQDSKINTIKNSGYNNASISDIVLLPVTLLNTLVDGLSSNSCTSFNLGSFYNNDIVLPCYTSSDISGWLGNAVYTIVDLLMSFGVILGIRKLVLKIYNTIVFLREGGNTVD